MTVVTAIFALQAQKPGGTGASEFARTKTLAEQREYLPVRQVRDDLMRVVADHQVQFPWIDQSDDKVCIANIGAVVKCAAAQYGCFIAQHRLYCST